MKQKHPQLLAKYNNQTTPLKGEGFFMNSILPGTFSNGAALVKSQGVISLFLSS